ncbi:MAG TPA: hypothetical protein VEX13_10375 [Chloroflexia bacterium]|nr:hypothetical protein [Chloroflexia bacterium]
MLLDKFSPIYDFNEVHSITIHASPDRIFRAVKEVTPAEMPIFTLLIGLRSLPALLTGKRGRGRNFSNTQPLIGTALSSSFVLLAEQPNRELVVGTIGQFWRAAGGAYRVADAQEFLASCPPGYAKAAMNFFVYHKPGSAGTRLRTETRIYIPDPGARRRFAAYWRVIYPGSAVIRIAWLRAIKHRAERS